MTTDSDTVFDFDESVLAPEEIYAFATNVILCFACRRNEWSTYDDLFVIYKQYKPENVRTTNVNIRENICDWNRIARENKLGDLHSEEDRQGCMLTSPHRVCRKNTICRIHPIFADKLFTESDKKMSDLLASRTSKRKRSVDEEVIVRKQKVRLLKALHRKVKEVEKVQSLLNGLGVDINLSLTYNPGSTKLVEVKDENASKSTEETIES